ncbi:MAG: hypothetical protein AB7V56_14985 [Candidatus Nitrosocosmicus sp.]|jgi:hypothetical protein|uniref:hypothetical protein n=1 Tax=Candidatus Nitrosocosmicus agrestis TaxID=2563600 RepID=UPI00122E4C20|nr:hypothetical protein [Candidatus Nitrosocosmicus sp. SS]KAA2278894.1 hypothetical protein F1Z66_14755 [Candidatus Nitrosocosmicus sp. SS]KAF0868111.1 hypothetical protein E5N71_11695 [Candidatus Nitrosocosmicus sp. SS]
MSCDKRLKDSQTCVICMPVRRGGRNVVTVEIFIENYEKMKQRAIQKRLNIKEYVNDFLQLYLEKEEFLSRVAPSLSVDSYEGNRITLKDTNKKVLVDVFYSNGELQCDVDQSNNCIHTKFIWMIPEISKIKTNDTRIKE